MRAKLSRKELRKEGKKEEVHTRETQTEGEEEEKDENQLLKEAFLEKAKALFEALDVEERGALDVEQVSFFLDLTNLKFSAVELMSRYDARMKEIAAKRQRERQRKARAAEVKWRREQTEKVRRYRYLRKKAAKARYAQILEEKRSMRLVLNDTKVQLERSVAYRSRALLFQMDKIPPPRVNQRIIEKDREEKERKYMAGEDCSEGSTRGDTVRDASGGTPAASQGKTLEAGAQHSDDEDSSDTSRSDAGSDSDVDSDDFDEKSTYQKELEHELLQEREWNGRNERGTVLIPFSDLAETLEEVDLLPNPKSSRGLAFVKGTRSIQQSISDMFRVLAQREILWKRRKAFVKRTREVIRKEVPARFACPKCPRTFGLWSLYQLHLRLGCSVHDVRRVMEGPTFTYQRRGQRRASRG